MRYIRYIMWYVLGITVACAPCTIARDTGHVFSQKAFQSRLTYKKIAFTVAGIVILGCAAYYGWSKHSSVNTVLEDEDQNQTPEEVAGDNLHNAADSQVDDHVSSSGSNPGNGDFVTMSDERFWQCLRNAEQIDPRPNRNSGESQRPMRLID